jgi:hypothetical protein
MNIRVPLFGAAALLALTFGAGSSYAISEGEIIRMHEACVHGDRAACEHRNAVIHDHDHETEWRRVHPDWYR